MQEKRSNAPNIMNVYMYPTKEYIKDDNAGPIINPAPIAVSAYPRYYSEFPGNSIVIMEKQAT
jgi:hypothetical protein